MLAKAPGDYASVRPDRTECPLLDITQRGSVYGMRHMGSNVDSAGEIDNDDPEGLENAPGYAPGT